MSISLSRALRATTAIALAAAVGFIVNDKPEAPTPAVTAVSDAQHSRLANLERELHALSSLPRSGEPAPTDLEQRLEALKREMAILWKTTNSPIAPDAQTPVDPLEQEQREREHLQQEIALMENALGSEPADASGSMTAAAEISRIMQGPGLEQTNVVGVQCNTTMCRIDVSHSSAQSVMQFNIALNQLETFQNSEGFVQQLPRADGGVDVVMYVSRENHSLPAAPQG